MFSIISAMCTMMGFAGFSRPGNLGGERTSQVVGRKFLLRLFMDEMIKLSVYMRSGLS